MNKYINSVLQNIEPKYVWKFFDELTQIPRQSGNEEGVRNWLIAIAKQNNFEYFTDNVENLLIKIPSKNSQSKDPICLQSHMDMVCVKDPNKIHDFNNDPLTLKKNGDTIKADNTTLGADNGIGLCMSLAIAFDENITHPPLELLFTVDEEVGLKGADNLNPKALQMKSKILINLDTEDIGEICIGCAGGERFTGTRKFEKKVNSNKFTYSLTINGLKGGHSGVEIHKNRANAFKVGISILENIDLEIVSIDGGQALNAIPANATFIFQIDNEINISDKISKTKEYVLKNHDEENIEIELNKLERKFTSLSQNDSKILMETLSNIPHGVKSMHPKIADLVQTSNNLARVVTKDDIFIIECFSRSSSEEDLYKFTNEIKNILKINNFVIEDGSVLKPWEGDPDTNLVKLTSECHKEILDPLGIKTHIILIHAGLECGTIGAKFEKMESVSFGPTIKNAHTPEEYVSIKDTELVYEILKKLISKLS